MARIAGINIPQNKVVSVALTYIHGIGYYSSKKICKEAIKSLGASSIKDMGKIMGALKKKYSDSVDFSKVNTIVKGLLNQ